MRGKFELKLQEAERILAGKLVELENRKAELERRSGLVAGLKP